MLYLVMALGFGQSQWPALSGLFLLVAGFGGAAFSAGATGPLPRPSTPWQGLQ